MPSIRSIRLTSNAVAPVATSETHHDAAGQPVAAADRGGLLGPPRVGPVEVAGGELVAQGEDPQRVPGLVVAHNCAHALQRNGRLVVSDR